MREYSRVSELATAPVTSAALPGRWLLVLGAEVTGHPLPASGRVTVGRSRSADVVLDDTTVSRTHVAIEIGPSLIVEDLGSQNGVRVGPRRLAPNERVEVRAGEPFVLGKLVVVIQDGSAVMGSRDAASTGRRLSAAPPTPIAVPDGVLVRSEAMRSIYELVARIAHATINVLVSGETGVGKELVATALHRGSRRASGPFLKLNCAAIAPSIVESELFGYEAGAFSGAMSAKIGLLETANGGTIFLDEIGELPSSMQAKLLRVIEQRELLRVGGVDPVPLDVRFVAATHRDLWQEVEAGRFRADLLYRLNGMTVSVPPLRDRREEIGPLAELFAKRAAREIGLASTPRIDPACRAALEAHPWPGNVRELGHAMTHAVTLARADVIRIEHLPPQIGLDGQARRAGLRGELDDIERQRILGALAQCDGNQSRAAKLLGMPRRTFLNRLDEYDIERPRRDKKRP
jgi:two-component system response regulator AtoC